MQTSRVGNIKRYLQMEILFWWFLKIKHTTRDVSCKLWVGYQNRLFFQLKCGMNITRTCLVSSSFTKTHQIFITQWSWLNFPTHSTVHWINKLKTFCPFCLFIVIIIIVCHLPLVFVQHSCPHPPHVSCVTPIHITNSHSSTKKGALAKPKQLGAFMCCVPVVSRFNGSGGGGE